MRVDSASAVTSSRMPPVSGAIGHTASQRAMSSPHPAHKSSGSTARMSAATSRSRIAGSRATTTSTPGRRDRSPASARTIIAPSAISDAGAAHSRHPPAVTYSNAKIRKSRPSPMAPFAIVPVLDLKGGQVVHARAGDRSRYLPVQSKLAAGSEPRAVLDGLLSLAPFRRVYIADLDAIEGRGDHRGHIGELARHYPTVAFWLDAGFAGAAEAAAALAEGATPVLGSESLPDEQALIEAVRRLGMAKCVLSLDYRGERFVGPAAIEARPELWPDQVIAMTLSRVGGGAGPDTTRHAADLDRLAAMGLAGALVASALHDGRLDAAALAAFDQRGRSPA